MTDREQLRVNGRPARVAVLVYNDAHADTRVLKTAATLREAGAEVKIFAVARARSGYPVGRERLGSGVELERLPEFELARSAPWLANVYRSMMARVRILAARGEIAPPQPPQPESAATPSSRASAAFCDLWLRVYRTVSLAVYWWGAVHAAIRWRPDVVHANDANTLVPAMRIARRVRGSFVYDSHELWRHRNVRSDRPVAPLVEHVIERLGIRRAAGVITVSPSIADWLQRTYRLASTPTLVRNIPPANPHPIDPTGGGLRGLAGLEGHIKVIAYGGRLTTSRGIEETLEAMGHLADDVHLVLLGYGEPDYVEPLRARARAAGLGHRVHFVGKVPSADVSSTLADADLSVVYVRPSCLSYYYSLPNKLFESIHAGLPIAAADLPDTRAIVEQFGVGRIFTTESTEDLAAVMTEILDDPVAYRGAAREAARHLTWENEAEGLLELYGRALELAENR